MLPDNLESEFHFNKNELIQIVNEISNILEKLCEINYANKDIELSLKVPCTDAKHSYSFKILEFKNSKNLIITEAIQEAAEYLKKLKIRALDNSSRVLITGDLNSGKSTLINAILNQNILPTDQQPCTQSFCEIISAENSQTENKIIAYKSIEIDIDLNCGFEINQDTMQLELQNEDSVYKWFKIYIPASIYINFSQYQISISFIDSPGLNTDLFKTTSLFDQQQDIDVVIFVVNASFHLTLSGKEFLEQAAKEKEQIFFVVNKVDEIENLKKCKKLVIRQINEILPGTVENAQNLIHFVSSKNYLMELREYDAVPSKDIGLNDDKATLKQQHSKFKSNFDEMKQELLNFLYVKRSISKLAPVKTYSTKLLQDLFELTKFNFENTESELSCCREKFDNCFKAVQMQESFEFQLKIKLSNVSSKTSETCYNQALLIASSFSDNISKMIQINKHSGIWKIRWNIHNNYEKLSQQYSLMIQDLMQTTNDYKRKGLVELDSLSELYGIDHGSDSHALRHNEFKLYSEMPLHKPTLLELFDPRDFLINYGAFNITSLIGAVVGFQPCLNLAWNFARRVGFNPLILSTLMIGGLGTFAIIKASSSIEREVLTKLDNYFTSRFNKEIWAPDLADRCTQSVCSTITSRSSQIYVKYQQSLDINRRSLVEISEKTELLLVSRDSIFGLNKRIESLLQSCLKINL